MKFGAAVLSLVVLSAAQAGAQTSAPAPAAASSDADSQIRITRLSQYRSPLQANGLGNESMVCVSFVNESQRTVNHVRFVFAYDDTNGTTVGADVLDRRGTFSTGVPIEGWTSLLQEQHSGEVGRARNCRPIGPAHAGVDDEGGIEFGHHALRAIRAFVETVDYADGTSWHAQPPYASLIGKPVVARAGEVGARADGGVDWTAPHGAPIQITHAHFFLLGPKWLECISFKNVAEKPATAFQVRFRFRAADGSTAEDNTQTRTGTFGPGVENVGGFDGQHPGGNCWSYPFLKDEPSQVLITIPSVTFADGTTVTPNP
jgi:hypothetical protein